MDSIGITGGATEVGRIVEIGPVRRTTASESPDGIARWLVTRHDDVIAALSDTRLSSVQGQCRRLGGSPLVDEEPATVRLMRRTMITNDPPGHTRLRKLIVREFSAKRIVALRPRVRQIADELLDAMAGHEEVDIVKTFGFRLPVRVIGEVLGVPDIGSQLLASDGKRSARIPMDVAHPVVVEWIEMRRRQPADDLVGRLVAAHERGDLSYDELVATPLLLLVAGHLTTSHLFGNGLVMLLRHPDQLAELRRDPTLMPSAVDEVLRHVGPAAFVGRYAHEDVEIGGTTIPAGSFVRVMLHAAKHDPDRFAEPEGFDIHRGASVELAFGHGIHFCLGARLAKLEGEVGLAALLRRFPGITLAEPVTFSAREDGILGLEELRVRLRNP